MRSEPFYRTLMNYVGVALGAASLGSDGKVPASELPYLSGALVQMVTTQVTGFTTTNGIIPDDNTPILAAEGGRLGLSVTMKPTSALNQVYVWGNLIGANSGSTQVLVGLFVAGSSSAVTGCKNQAAAAGIMQPVTFLWQATTVSAASTTYALNVGGPGAGTTTLNGEGGAGKFGNSVVSALTVAEVQN
jgi:hypothetical protein